MSTAGTTAELKPRDRAECGVLFHLAEFNGATLSVAIDDPVLVPFLSAVEPVLAAAEAADGFVARNSFLGPFTHLLRPAPRSAAPRAVSGSPVRQDPSMVLWRVPSGQLPEPAEAVERLNRLTANGPTAARLLPRPFDAPIEH